MGISRFVGAFTNARFSPLLRFNHKSWTALDECFDQLTWGSLLLCLDLQVWRTRSVESPSGLMVISICLGQSITMVLSSKSVSFGRYVSLNMDDSIKGYGSSPLVCLNRYLWCALDSVIRSYATGSLYYCVSITSKGFSRHVGLDREIRFSSGSSLIRSRWFAQRVLIRSSSVGTLISNVSIS